MTEERKKTAYERVADAMHGVDDTVRDIVVYPSNTDVIGISEGEDYLVLSHANNHDEGNTQMVWINAMEEIEPLLALREAITRILDRAAAKAVHS